MASDIDVQLLTSAGAGFVFPPLLDAAARFLPDLYDGVLQTASNIHHATMPALPAMSSVLHAGYALTTATLFSVAAAICIAKGRDNRAAISRLKGPYTDFEGDEEHKRSARKHLRRLTWSSFGGAAAATVVVNTFGAVFLDSPLFTGNPFWEAVSAAVVLAPSAYHLVRSPTKLDWRLRQFCNTP